MVFINFSCKGMCCFAINFISYNITTHIKIQLSNYLQHKEGIKSHQNTSGSLDKNKKDIKLYSDVLIMVSRILHLEVSAQLERV